MKFFKNPGDCHAANNNSFKMFYINKVIIVIIIIVVIVVVFDFDSKRAFVGIFMNCEFDFWSQQSRITMPLNTLFLLQKFCINTFSLQFILSGSLFMATVQQSPGLENVHI